MQGRSGVYIWADMQADGRRADGGDGGSCLATAGRHAWAGGMQGRFGTIVYSASRRVQHYNERSSALGEPRSATLLRRACVETISKLEYFVTEDGSPVHPLNIEHVAPT